MNKYEELGLFRAGNCIISIDSVRFAELDEKDGLLIEVEGQEQPVIVGDSDEAESIWIYLSNRAYPYTASLPVRVNSR